MRVIVCVCVCVRQREKGVILHKLMVQDIVCVHQHSIHIHSVLAAASLCPNRVLQCVFSIDYVVRLTWTVIISDKGQQVSLGGREHAVINRLFWLLFPGKESRVICDSQYYCTEDTLSAGLRYRTSSEHGISTDGSEKESRLNRGLRGDVRRNDAGRPV